jgi:Kef-type K+ transport system membrane component KefB
MFLVGIEFDSRSLRQKSLAVLSISLSSMIIPFLLGIALALFLFETYAPSGIDFLRFSLFIGAAMSITAFPVLVRILQDLKLENQPFAKLAISCAALDDALAWCLLAVVVGISQGDSWLVLRQFTGLMFFLTIQWFLIRPWIGRMEVLAEKQGLSGETLPLLFCLLFVSSMITEKLGVHALFGAFVVGSLVSKESRLAHEIQEKTGTLLLVLFIPLFFAQAGLKTQISLLFTTEGLCLSALVIGLATIGKIGGTYIAAFTHTKDSHEAWSLSVLMNTRGLMEIIVLTLGLQMGIIDERLFTIFVTMALVTTLMTAPLLSSKHSGSIVKRP